MKLSKYLKDKIYTVIIFGISYLVILLLLYAFKVDNSLILVISIILFLAYLLILAIDYLRKKNFYNYLFSNIEKLDKSYLVLETLKKPDFYEGKLLFQALYEIDKSMAENVKMNEEQLQNFKDYIEMWIHEVKNPLASLVLKINNGSGKFDKKTKSTLKELEDCVEKVLYYVRCEYSEKDYFIKKVSLAKIVKAEGIKNMNSLLDNKVDFIVENIDYYVETDSKWLEFILEQIISNSIKYKKDIKDSYIKIYGIEKDKNIVLVVEDNGIGIKNEDIKYVFDKTFTGNNGRGRSTSTGMGLYIAKNLCNKLGHKIEIESKEGVYTKVMITFSLNNYYFRLK